jgi:putative ABC transport system permease protein
MVSQSMAIFAQSFRRNIVYGIVDILGLALGFLAAILLALFVAHEFSYERFLPEHENVHRVSSLFKRADASLDTAQKQLAGILPREVPGVEAATRLLSERHSLRRGNVEYNEDIYWADPNLFEILRLPVLHSRGGALLRAPDSMVVTERVARKYFGRADVVGETLELARERRFEISGVLRDLPSNTHLNTEIIVSGNAARSGIKTLDADDPDDISAPVYTYFRVTPGTSLDSLRAAMPGVLDRHWPQSSGQKMSEIVQLKVFPIRDIHLHGTGLFSMRPGGNPDVARALALVGVLIVIAACINFINLMTARASRRMVEVGVRKCFGASRRDLIVQFIGEASAFVAIAFVLAVAAAHLLLPAFNAFVGTEIVFDWWRRPLLLLGMAAAIVVIGTLAGLYPAFFLSSFRPAGVLRSGRASNSGSNLLRRALIVVQFAVVVGLLVTVLTIRSQMEYAMSRTTNAANAAVLAVETDCKGSFPEAVRRIPGVNGAACSQSAPTNRNKIGTTAVREDGQSFQVDVSPVDFGFFQLYEMRPLAGRFFVRERPADAYVEDTRFSAPLVLNETAVRKLGFGSPRQAIGKRVTLNHEDEAAPSEIVGVVPDFVVESLREPIAATAYFVAPDSYELLHVSIDSTRRQEVTAAIDRLWTQVAGADQPISRFYIEDYFSDLYETMRLELALFTALAVVAAVIAAIGLFGLAAFTADRRVKEIGIRKALGAETRDVMRLLLWQFAKPILWANAIAWPVAALLLINWLNGFAYHIPLPWHFFLLCGLLSLIAAIAFVSFQIYRAARARPAQALQYE